MDAKTPKYPVFEQELRICPKRRMAKIEPKHGANKFDNWVLNRNFILTIATFTAQNEPRQDGNVVVGFNFLPALRACTRWRNDREVIGDAIDHDVGKRPDASRKKRAKHIQEHDKILEIRFHGYYSKKNVSLSPFFSMHDST